MTEQWESYRPADAGRVPLWHRLYCRAYARAVQVIARCNIPR